MHLHSLQVKAFGPFGSEARVDFDDLSGAGLFLFTGPTGAGKSSVLDAICFALYGVVPGSRQSARQLRSDHAAPDVTPVVQLEFSVDDRRFLIRRSPAWQRPKRRGSGVTTQHAAVTLEEFQGGVWHVLSTRLDETGDLVGSILGMRPSQFTQVAMLPQGEFQQFLCAKSDDRQAILQRLFRTDRFEAVERWLRERRTDLRNQCSDRLQELSAILSRIEEATDVRRPESLDATDLSQGLRSQTVTDWVGELRRRSALDLEAAVVCVKVRREEAAAAHELHQTALSLAASQHRGRAAAEVIATLAASSERAGLDAARLRADVLAQPGLALARELQQAEKRLASAKIRAAASLDAVGLPGGSTLEFARDQLAASRRGLHAVLDFAPQQQTLDESLRQQREVEDSLAALLAAIPTMQAELAAIPSERESLETTRDRAEAAHGVLAQIEVALQTALAGSAAANELEKLRPRLARQQAALTTAVQHHQDRREAYQDLREARINAMAGELASQLAVGCSCPVCGSETHPHPATATGTIGPEAENVARIAMDDAAIAVETLRDGVRTLQHRVLGLDEVAGSRDASAWTGEVATCRARLDETRTMAEELAPARAVLARLTGRETELTAALSSAEADAAQLVIRIDHLDTTITDLRSQLDALLEGIAAPDLAAAHLRLEKLVPQLELLVDRLLEVESCTSTVKHARRAVLTELDRAGFDDVEALEDAALTEIERQELLSGQQQRAAAAATAQATLDESEIKEAMLAAVPDLENLSSQAAQAATARDAAVAEHGRLSLRVDRVDQLADDVAAAVEHWRPVFEDFQVTSGLAELVEGKSADNEFRMRLSAYVLSERLGQVVAAANDRLIRMGCDRFTLEQSDHGAARDRRGGLGLRVRDGWTSTQRETGTLSGGETFMVSLALALGLADTVTAESGGTRIETLFVDEGFGSLDAESLEGVLDTLDSLREGGRAVGVVSHVPEMRERIPAQVQVSSSPQHGSTLQVVLGV